MSMRLLAGSQDHLPDVLGRLYATALEPQLMGQAMDDVCTWLGTSGAAYTCWDPQKAALVCSALSSSVADRYVKNYANYYVHIDPRLQWVSKVPTGQIFTCQQFISDRDVNRSEFYQEHLLPNGGRYTMGGYINREDNAHDMVSFYQRPDMPPFTDDQIRDTGRLMPHFRRLLGMHRQSTLLREVARHGQIALNALDQGVLLLDWQGAVVLANSRAEALLRQQDALATSMDRLAAVDHKSHLHLSAAIQRVVQFGIPESMTLTSLLQSSQPDDRPTPAYYLTLIPLARPPASLAGIMDHRAALLVLVNVPHGQRAVTVQQLMQLFSLTPAEARLAHALAQGLSVDDYVQAHALSMPTARKQLRSVVEKAGVARQQELVRHLAMLPSARHHKTSKS